MTRSQTKLNEELKAYLEELISPLARKDDLKGLATVQSINQSLVNLEKKLLNKIDELQQKISQLEEKVNRLEENLTIYKNDNELLSRKIDDAEQYGRRMCLRIEGIDLDENETPSRCIEKVVKTLRVDLNIEVTPEELERAHRIGPKKAVDHGVEKQHAQMIIKVFKWETRNRIYRARKDGHSKGISVRLDFTKRRLNILNEARNITKNSSNVEFVFADINCRLGVRFVNGPLRFFNSLAELNNLLQQ